MTVTLEGMPTAAENEEKSKDMGKKEQEEEEMPGAMRAFARNVKVCPVPALTANFVCVFWTQSLSSSTCSKRRRVLLH